MPVLFTKEKILDLSNIYPVKLQSPILALVERSDGSFSVGEVTHSTYVRNLNGKETKLVTVHFREGIDELNKTIKYRDVEKRDDFDYLLETIFSAK